MIFANNSMLIRSRNQIRYVPLEYLESTGSQWIDLQCTTGNGVQEFIIETEIAWLKSDTSRQLSGADNTQWIGVQGGKWELTQTGSTYTVGTFYNVKNVVSIDDGNRYTQLFVNGVLDIYIIAHKLDTIKNNPQYVFNIGSSDFAYSLHCTCKIKYWRLTRDGILVRSLVPCIRLPDGKPGMYDACGSICPLTGTPFYINSGTGADFKYPASSS